MDEFLSFSCILYSYLSAPAKWLLLRILIRMGTDYLSFSKPVGSAFIEGLTCCSVARCENVITPAVSGLMPTTATHLAAESHSHILPHTDTKSGKKIQHRRRISNKMLC